MFDQTFVDGAGKTSRCWTWTLSFFGEFAAIGVMILVPLIWTEVLPKARSLDSLLTPAPPPAPPPPARPSVIRPLRAVSRRFNRNVLEAPRVIPRQVPMIAEDAPPSPANLDDRLNTGLPGDALAGTSGIAADRIGIGVPPPLPPPAKTDVKPPHEKPLLVGGKIQSAKLIKHPTPLYPAIAKSARIQGTVVLQAIISRDGTVRNLTVLRAASPLLVAAALDAVKQWVYQPTLLNQEPVEVSTEITIIFSLQ
jgi:periplasmic protein TonB